MMVKVPRSPKPTLVKHLHANEHVAARLFEDDVTESQRAKAVVHPRTPDVLGGYGASFAKRNNRNN
jgi:hypothetical protein